ncbi:hypothetical protein KAX75_08510 [candidate division WOR-3 bacterium]|nr:hypothetical protein [candidate division WOR-3 bacterium]
MLKRRSIFGGIVAVICLASMVVVQGFEWEYTEEEAKLYKMDIHQITPDSGITTGHIIAYGHYIKPPYKIEVKDTIVYVNGVQIHPTLLSPGEKKKREEEKKATIERKKKKAEVRKRIESDPELMQLIQKAKEAYRKVTKKERKKRGEGFNAAAEVFRSSSRVDDVNIGGNAIVVYFNGLRPSYLITEVDFDPSLRKTPEEIARIVKQEEEIRRKTWEDFYKQAEEEGYPPNKYGLKLRAADGEAQFLRKLLNSGNGKVYEPTHLATIRENNAIFIVRVLRDPFLSPQEKTYILKSKWYMHNFIPSEWPTIKEIGKSWKNGKEHLKEAEESIKRGKEKAKEFIEKLERVRRELNNEK